MPWMLRRGGHLPQWWTSGSWMSRCWTPISVSRHPNSSTRQYFSPPKKKQINVTDIFFLQNITNSLLTTLLLFPYPFCVRYAAFTSFSDYFIPKLHTNILATISSISSSGTFLIFFYLCLYMYSDIAPPLPPRWTGLSWWPGPDWSARRTPPCSGLCSSPGRLWSCSPPPPSAGSPGPVSLGPSVRSSVDRSSSACQRN